MFSLPWFLSLFRLFATTPRRKRADRSNRQLSVTVDGRKPPNTKLRFSFLLKLKSKLSSVFCWSRNPAALRRLQESVASSSQFISMIFEVLADFFAPSPPLTFRMSLPVNSRLDFGMSLTLVRFLEALDFVAMILSFPFVLELLSVGNNSLACA